MLIKLLMITLIINVFQSSFALEFRSIIYGKYLYVLWSDYRIFRYNMDDLIHGYDRPILYSNSSLAGKPPIVKSSGIQGNENGLFSFNILDNNNVWQTVLILNNGTFPYEQEFTNHFIVRDDTLFPGPVYHKISRENLTDEQQLIFNQITSSKNGKLSADILPKNTFILIGDIIVIQNNNSYDYYEIAEVSDSKISVFKLLLNTNSSLVETDGLQFIDKIASNYFDNYLSPMIYRENDILKLSINGKKTQKILKLSQEYLSGLTYNNHHLLIRLRKSKYELVELSDLSTIKNQYIRSSDSQLCKNDGNIYEIKSDPEHTNYTVSQYNLITHQGHILSIHARDYQLQSITNIIVKLNMLIIAGASTRHIGTLIIIMYLHDGVIGANKVSIFGNYIIRAYTQFINDSYWYLVDGNNKLKIINKMKTILTITFRENVDHSISIVDGLSPPSYDTPIDHDFIHLGFDLPPPYNESNHIGTHIVDIDRISDHMLIAVGNNNTMFLLSHDNGKNWHIMSKKETLLHTFTHIIYLPQSASCLLLKQTNKQFSIVSNCVTSDPKFQEIGFQGYISDIVQESGHLLGVGRLGNIWEFNKNTLELLKHTRLDNCPNLNAITIHQNLEVAVGTNGCIALRVNNEWIPYVNQHNDTYISVSIDDKNKQIVILSNNNVLTTLSYTHTNNTYKFDQQINLHPFTETHLVGLATNNAGTSVAIGKNGLLLYSYDAKTWHKIEKIPAFNLNKIKIFGNRFIVMGDSNTILYSDNGSTWEQSNIY